MAIGVLVLAPRSPDAQSGRPDEQLLRASLRFSPATDPGEFAELYEGLPADLNALCDLVKTQIIHPFDAGLYTGQIPDGRVYGDRDLPTVPAMLEELQRRDGRGLVEDREPGNRLPVAVD